MEENNRNENNKDDNNKRKPGGGSNVTLMVILIAVILTLSFIIQYNRIKSAGEEEVSYNEFIEMLDDGKIDKVEIYSEKIKFTPNDVDEKTENITYYVVRTDDYALVDRLEESDVEFIAIDEGGNAILGQILYYVVFFGAMYFITMMIFRAISKSGGGIMNVGKSNAKMYDMMKSTGITFKDVAGEEEAKESLTEMVDFLKNPQKYLEIGARLPKGALLVGPPGTGKTLLAKAVAGEAGVPFFSMSGSEFVEMYVGVGASRVRDLFKQANAKAPCIIFIDEIDAIGRSRDTRHMGGDSEREQTLNQLLSEMDGFDSAKGIIILAATNRPEVLDKALLRPGRFDRRVIVERPDLKGREDILKVHSKNVKLDETVDLHELAFATSGSVGADLENIVNEAALTAVRKGRKFVSQQDLLESVEVVFAGKEKKDRVLSAEEKSIVAYHEAGHALLTMLQKDTMPVQKITIVPRTMGALGYVWQTPEEEKYLETKTEMEAHIVITMGGRAAEALKFASVTTGASNDIEQATDAARKMVTMYGMSEKFGMVQLEGITGEYLDRRAVMQCSDETATMIDDEVRLIINNAYIRAYNILKENIKILDAIAIYLIDHESITGKEFMDIFNQVTGGVKPQIDKTTPLTSVDYTATTINRFGLDSPSSVVGEPVKVRTIADIPKKIKEKKAKDKVAKETKAVKEGKLSKEEKSGKAGKLTKEEKAALKEGKEKKSKKVKDKLKSLVKDKSEKKTKVFASEEFVKKRDELLKDDYDLDEAFDEAIDTVPVNADAVTEPLVADAETENLISEDAVEVGNNESGVVEVEASEEAEVEAAEVESEVEEAAEDGVEFIVEGSKAEESEVEESEVEESEDDTDSEADGSKEDSGKKKLPWE